MVWHSATVPGRLEDQAKLIADSLLTLELAESGGPQHGFGSTLGRVGVGTYECGEVLIADMTHDRDLLPCQSLQRGSHQDCDIDLRVVARQMRDVVACSVSILG